MIVGVGERGTVLIHVMSGGLGLRCSGVGLFIVGGLVHGLAGGGGGGSGSGRAGDDGNILSVGSGGDDVLRDDGGGTEDDTTILLSSILGCETSLLLSCEVLETSGIESCSRNARDGRRDRVVGDGRSGRCDWEARCKRNSRRKYSGYMRRMSGPGLAWLFDDVDLAPVGRHARNNSRMTRDGSDGRSGGGRRIDGHDGPVVLVVLVELGVRDEGRRVGLCGREFLGKEKIFGFLHLIQGERVLLRPRAAATVPCCAAILEGGAADSDRSPMVLTISKDRVVMFRLKSMELA